MLDLNSTIELDLRKFFRWWRRELAFLLPDRLREILQDQRGRLLMRVTEECWGLSYQCHGEMEAIAEFRRDERGMAELAALLERDERLAKADVIIRLNDDYAIAKELVFPLAVAENLAQTVVYELDRYTPFKPEQVYFSVKTTERNKLTGQLRCVLVLTPQEKLDALVEEVFALGLRPGRVEYEGVPNNGAAGVQPYNLLPERLRLKPEVLPKLVHGGLFGASVALLVTTLVLPVWWQNRTVLALRTKVNHIAKEAQEVDKLQKEMEGLIGQTNKLFDKKRSAPSQVELLNLLTVLIKDDTWLLHFHYTDGRLQIQGQSPSASALISLLEKSELLANARFVSPVTQDVRSGLERFQISVDVKPEKS